MRKFQILLDNLFLSHSGVWFLIILFQRYCAFILKLYWKLCSIYHYFSNCHNIKYCFLWQPLGRVHWKLKTTASFFINKLYLSLFCYFSNILCNIVRGKNNFQSTQETNYLSDEYGSRVKTIFWFFLLSLSYETHLGLSTERI